MPASGSASRRACPPPVAGLGRPPVQEAGLAALGVGGADNFPQPRARVGGRVGLLTGGPRLVESLTFSGIKPYGRAPTQEHEKVAGGTRPGISTAGPIPTPSEPPQYPVRMPANPATKCRSETSRTGTRDVRDGGCRTLPIDGNGRKHPGQTTRRSACPI